MVVLGVQLPPQLHLLWQQAVLTALHCVCGLCRRTVWADTLTCCSSPGLAVQVLDLRPPPLDLLLHSAVGDGGAGLPAQCCAARAAPPAAALALSTWACPRPLQARTRAGRSGCLWGPRPSKALIRFLSCTGAKCTPWRSAAAKFGNCSRNCSRTKRLFKSQSSARGINKQFVVRLPWRPSIGSTGARRGRAILQLLPGLFPPSRRGRH